MICQEQWYGALGRFNLGMQISALSMQASPGEHFLKISNVSGTDRDLNAILIQNSATAFRVNNTTAVSRAATAIVGCTAAAT